MQYARSQWHSQNQVQMRTVIGEVGARHATVAQSPRNALYRFMNVAQYGHSGLQRLHGTE